MLWSSECVTFIGTGAMNRQQHRLAPLFWRTWSKELGASPGMKIAPPSGTIWPTCPACQVCNQPSTCLYRIAHMDGRGAKHLAWDAARRIAQRHTAAPAPETNTGRLYEREMSLFPRMRQDLYSQFLTSGLVVCNGDFVAHTTTSDETFSRDPRYGKMHWAAMHKGVGTTALQGLSFNERQLIASCLLAPQETRTDDAIQRSPPFTKSPPSTSIAACKPHSRNSTRRPQSSRASCSRRPKKSLYLTTKSPATENGIPRLPLWTRPGRIHGHALPNVLRNAESSSSNPELLNARRLRRSLHASVAGWEEKRSPFCGLTHKFCLNSSSSANS